MLRARVRIMLRARVRIMLRARVTVSPHAQWSSTLTLTLTLTLIRGHLACFHSTRHPGNSSENTSYRVRIRVRESPSGGLSVGPKADPSYLYSLILPW